MIIAIVRFPLEETMTLDRARDLYGEYGVKYQNMPGLLTKYYVYGDDNKGGAIYFWESRAYAEAQYTPDWYEHMTRRWGVRPNVEIVENPVTVDNISNEIRRNR